VKQSANVKKAVRSILAWAKADQNSYDGDVREHSCIENACEFIARRSTCTPLGLATEQENNDARRTLCDYLKKIKYERAMRFLCRARRGRGDVREAVNDLLHIVQGMRWYGAPTLAELGTDTEELSQLLKRGYIRRAQRSLTSIRASVQRGKINGNNLQPLKDTSVYAKLAGITLSEIGICQTEYEHLCITVYRLYAEYLRTMKDSYSRTYAVWRTLSLAKEFGLTLEELNTSREELVQMLHLSPKTIARWKECSNPKELSGMEFECAVQLGLFRHEESAAFSSSAKEKEKHCVQAKLDKLRDIVNNGECQVASEEPSYDSVTWLRRWMKEAGLSPMDIGTSDRELYNIERAIALRLARNDLLLMRKYGKGDGTWANGCLIPQLNYILSIMEKFNLTPNDVGVSKSEIDLLRYKRE